MIGRERQLELLAIVATFGDFGCTPREFARAAFPDSPHWNDLPKNPRRGALRGGRVVSAAAGLLGQLSADRLLLRRGSGQYLLTPGSRRLLQRAGVEVAGNEPPKSEEIQPKSSDVPEVTKRALQPAPMQWLPDRAGGWWSWDGTTLHFVDAFGTHFVCYAGQWVCVGSPSWGYNSTAAYG